MEKRLKLEHWQLVRLCLILYDVVAVNAAYFFALWLRFDLKLSQIETHYMDAFFGFAPFYTVICIVVFWILNLYRSIWRFASFVELQRVFVANIITFAVHAAGISLLFNRMPISYYVIGGLLQFCLTLLLRFGYRLIILLKAQSVKRADDSMLHNVMLIGAGDAGQLILYDIIRSKKSKDRVVCIIDDNRDKWGRYLSGVQIVGGRDDIMLNCEKYNIEKIYVAIPTASASDKRDILNICKETGCELKSLPGMYQIYSGEVTVSAMKNIEIEDLLGRDQIRVNMNEVYDFINERVILVTGGGGSIGSELCRQIAKHNPKQLIIFDIYENNAYDIQQELQRMYPDMDLVVLIGSVRDSRRMMQVFDLYRPEIVYHAAAHKHVPLMEESPCEAIKNNVAGTYKTAYAAMVYGTERFVLISTDKAVNPTNVMGASKRVCEMIIQAFDHRVKEGRADEIPPLSTHTGKNITAVKDGDPIVRLKNAKTEFVSVRFGNVLGSNGSVIPLFRKQIALGGPVTVTHPNIIRYFMTIPEAVGLVMQAGTYAKGGEIFVLDMGDPVKIDTLARNLIKLSGFKPDVDIKIEYTGLRPGEKLYEEKLMAEEGLKRTENEKIHIGCPIPFETDVFFEQLAEMMNKAYDNAGNDDIKEFVKLVVETYKTGSAEDGVLNG